MAKCFMGLMYFSEGQKENTLMDHSPNEQYVVDKKGNPTAVILPIEDYKKILAVLEEIEDHRETMLLSQSTEFKKLVQKGLGDIKSDRIKPWKEVWHEL